MAASACRTPGRTRWSACVSPASRTASAGGWRTTAAGRSRASVPMSADATVRGLRFRPRCDVPYMLELATDDSFGGDATFTALADLTARDPVNPFTSTAPMPGTVPGDPLPDRDRDGLWDDIDRCPDQFSPANADADADGVGDECDVCPTVFNPNQGPAPFDMVTMTDATHIRMGEPGRLRLRGRARSISSRPMGRLWPAPVPVPLSPSVADPGPHSTTSSAALNAAPGAAPIATRPFPEGRSAFPLFPVRGAGREPERAWGVNAGGSLEGPCGPGFSLNSPAP